MEVYVQGASRMELGNAFFTLKNLLWEGVADEFTSTWKNLPKHWISSEFLWMEGYVQGALRKELHSVSFVERFKTATLGKHH